tara:strand:+ start:730 stop:1410 length:681 start_codon:yes stop_codon:yes gene_type:complete
MHSISKFTTLLFSFSLLFLQINCAKTTDVEPITEPINPVDTTNTDLDTVYLNANISGFIINEVLYDPPSGLPGDANNDGVRDPNEDEFVEFVNMSDSCIDLSYCKIFDTENLNLGTPNHQFPANTFLSSGKSLVVFGGGSPSGLFGNSIVLTSSNAVMNLNNSGDIMTLTDSLNNIILEFDVEPLSNNPNESYTRSPDLTGDFEQHATVITGVLFSPGTRVDGSPF